MDALEKCLAVFCCSIAVSCCGDSGSTDPQKLWSWRGPEKKYAYKYAYIDGWTSGSYTFWSCLKSHPEVDASLCYKRCRGGYEGVGPLCRQKDCPSGFRDDGFHCGKPRSYGRGGGYPWKFGDKAFSLRDARKRCERKHSQGCEKSGAIYYPKCRSGYHKFGCCVCSPNCPRGMTDIGVSCQKHTYGRGRGIGVRRIGIVSSLSDVSGSDIVSLSCDADGCTAYISGRGKYDNGVIFGKTPCPSCVLCEGRTWLGAPIDNISNKFSWKCRL